jgi:fumarate hydratase class I
MRKKLSSFYLNLNSRLLKQSILNLIRQAATNLPADVTNALLQARNNEAKASTGKLSLQVILKNIELARSCVTPICQDTGFPTFWVKTSQSHSAIRAAILAATAEATEKGLLRPNAMDSLTGKNLGNIGEGYPVIYFEDADSDSTEISLLLKGGGSENVSQQIALPATLADFGEASRDLAGVKKTVLQIVKDAQGKGCAPGVISVVIGGDRSSGFATAKKNFLQPIGSENPNPELAKLEAEILSAANKMGIGPLGLGGKTTLLDCKVASLARLPACFFVTVAYSCWATRRGRITLDSSGKIISDNFNEELIETELDLTKVKKLTLPLQASAVKKLKKGEVVLLSGKMFTGRDRLHEYALKKKLSKNLKDSAIFHCGPIAIQEAPRQARDKFSQEKIWRFLAAGPTTSARLEKYEADFIAKTGIRAVIGKGGMGKKTAAALKKHGGVYLHAIGGAAAFYANSIRKVVGVDFLTEFGMPEAMWEIEVADFLAVVG